MTMNDPVTWIALATIVVQGIFALALIRFRATLGEWTEELRKERRAANAVVQSNQNVVNWLARHTGTRPDPLPYSDDEDQQSA
jgi:hypothetical protein